MSLDVTSPRLRGRLACQPVVEPPSERDFYQRYGWCLNPFPTVGEAVEYLGIEIDRLRAPLEAWQTGEVMTNVFLLSGAVLNAVDEYLRGKTLPLGRRSAGRLVRSARWATETLGAVLRWRRRGRVRRWRESLQAPLDRFLSLFIDKGTPDPIALALAGDGLAAVLRSPLPSDLRAEPIHIPSAFRKLDLTHHDLIELGRRYIARFPERAQPLLVLGLRTAGSYFVPLLRALLMAEGYRTVDSLTIHPDKGPGARESAELSRCARAGHGVVILDDPPFTGDTFVLAVDMVRKIGFASDQVTVLIPAHPARPDCGKSLSSTGTVVLVLEPGEWHKQRLLHPKWVETRLAEYFQGERYAGSCVVVSAAADEINRRLASESRDARCDRLKRVYEVRLQTPEGGEETRYILAKSVGWGWLGYHAFLAGTRLAGFVPPVHGLRDGILYSEWMPQPPTANPEAEDREQRVQTTVSYIAARVRLLGLEKRPAPALGLHQHDGFRLLEKVLSRAYGRFLTAVLMRPRVRHHLAQQPCPCPTLIDGRMERSEWIAGPCGPLKTDYEHHGMGKNELNVLDPAYDLADAVLQLALSPEEESRLIRGYVEESGDPGVEARLFQNKLLAGIWGMASAQKGLFQQTQTADRVRELNRQFIDAVHFLTIQTARFCGALCRPAQEVGWRAPLVVLDVDGVIDRRLFGFPCTTAAGIRAIALLHAHEFSVALDTARSAVEVQEYCRAYGFAGGVAEYGAFLWDAVNQRGRVLVSPESLRQLDVARTALAQVPGVFLDQRYHYSIRAYTFEEPAKTLGRLPVPSPVRSILAATTDDKAAVPLPHLLVRQLLAGLGLDRLLIHQTTLDTTITAKEVDKGTGLAALRDWVGLADAETLAVGDSEPDLAMFRQATRAFAPSHISCARQARLLGCRIDAQPYQRGLLNIVRFLAHPDGGRCQRCVSGDTPWAGTENLFLDLLQAADGKRSVALLRALFDPKAYEVFVR